MCRLKEPILEIELNSEGLIARASPKGRAKGGLEETLMRRTLRKGTLNHLLGGRRAPPPLMMPLLGIRQKGRMQKGLEETGQRTSPTSFQLRTRDIAILIKIKERKILKNTHFVELKICPIMLRNIIGQIFNSTLDRFSAQPFSHCWWPFLSFLKIYSNLYLIGFSAKTNIFVAHPQKLGTLFVNTTALTDVFVCPFFCILGFWGFCCV